nr:protein NRT1/ PTR FAMILY 4.6-like [Ipomoea batatas]
MSGTETSDEEGRSKAKAEIQNATEDHGFLNKAAIEKPEFPSLYCTVKEVEEVKIVLRILPIFMSTIMLNCCLAQLSTFSVQQVATMNTKIGSLRIPPASLPVFPVLFVMVLALVYNHIIIPFIRKITKSEMGITHSQRIGTGLVLSIVAMAIAGLREQRWLRFEAIILHQFVELRKQLPQLGRVRVRRGLNRGGEAKRGADLGVVVLLMENGVDEGLDDGGERRLSDLRGNGRNGLDAGGVDGRVGVAEAAEDNDSSISAFLDFKSSRSCLSANSLAFSSISLRCESSIP